MESVNDKDYRGEQIIYIRSQKSLFDLQLGEVWRYRELLYFLIWRETKVRYKQAALGIGWAIIQPALAALIFSVVFGQFAKISSNGTPYIVFAYAALLPWTYFAEAVQRGSMGLVADSDLIRKIYFPRLIITLAMVMAPLVDFIFSFFILLVLLIFNHIIPTWNLIFIPLFMVIAMLLALAVNLWLGPINVSFRDVKYTIPFVLQVWMYASPVVYPLSMVPEQWRTLYSLNPMVGVIEGFRWALLGEHERNIVTLANEPWFSAMILAMTVIFILLMAGIVFFRRMEKSFADVI